MRLFQKLFTVPKPVIGMIALPPLLGYSEFPGMDAAIKRALHDLETLQQGGVDAVCVENDYDRPHRLLATPEVLACFTVIAREVAKRASVPVGLQVLLNDWRASLSIARVIDAHFVRLDFFVDQVRVQAGIIKPEPERILEFRKQIGAESIALLTDVQVKHSELLDSGKTLTSSIQQAIAHDSDAVVISGKLTGDAPALEELREAREAAGKFPILIGSGLTPENAGELFLDADGAIVGTSLKDHAGSDALIVLSRVEQLMDRVRAMRNN